jgi:hypothetical protein
MTNIKQNDKKKDVHSHIDAAYLIIEQHLPANYVQTVIEKLTDPTLTEGIIRNIKHRVTKYPATRLNVINALVEIALEHKSQKEKLASLTSDKSE